MTHTILKSVDARDRSARHRSGGSGKRTVLRTLGALGVLGVVVSACGSPTKPDSAASATSVTTTAVAPAAPVKLLSPEQTDICQKLAAFNVIAYTIDVAPNDKDVLAKGIDDTLSPAATAAPSLKGVLASIAADRLKKLSKPVPANISSAVMPIEQASAQLSKYVGDFCAPEPAAPNPSVR